MSSALCQASLGSCGCSGIRCNTFGDPVDKAVCYEKYDADDDGNKECIKTTCTIVDGLCSCTNVIETDSYWCSIKKGSSNSDSGDSQRVPSSN